MTSEKPQPMTNAEKQQALRQRHREEGRAELRGVYVPIDLHARVKKLIADWLKKHG